MNEHEAISMWKLGWGNMNDVLFGNGKPEVPRRRAIKSDWELRRMPRTRAHFDLGLIEGCAQAILDARANYPESSLAELYDPEKMPDDLRSAHEALDAAVEAAYGVDFDGDEEKIVTHLFKLYAEATEANAND